jgi:predicted DNA-binding protein
LSGGDAAAQVSALRDEMRASLYAIAKNTGRTANQLVRWDGDGLPEPRDY